MSNEKDPYPMTSPEAKSLSDSVRGGQRSGGNGVGGRRDQWSSMNTKSADAPDNDDGDDGNEMGEAAGSLTGKTRKLGGDGDDIYSQVDELTSKKDHSMDDEILDVPLDELRGSWVDRMMGSTERRMLQIYKRLYGNKLPPSEMIRTLTLASTLFFMIGGYWLLRSLKDTVLIALCGIQAIPRAKMLSVFVVLGVVSIYNYLLDSSLLKHQLFYIFGTFYFFLFTAIAMLLMDPKIGMDNKVQSESRILGWISYCAIESFGSVMVSLFWSFTNSNISLETAKASYGVMVAAAQIGSIIGPAIVNRYAEVLGPARCYLMGSACMILLQGCMYNYIRQYGTAEQRQKDQEDPADVPPGPPKKKEKAGVLEGLVLFYKHNYVKGIFAISCLFMVEVTIIDYTLKVLAQNFFSEEYPCEITNECYDAETETFGLTTEATNAIASFMGLFGVATNSLSFLFSLFGTSAVIRYLGLRTTLLLFPSLCLVVIICVRLRPTLYVVFGAMIMLKACSYALNNPTKEMLYQPTSPAVKYKAKSWIDIFGARGSKALGSVVTNAFSYSTSVLIENGSLVGMCVASFLIWNARFMGKLFDEYTESGYIVGDDDNRESKNIEMAIGQNDANADSTSCGLDDDDDDDDDEDHSNDHPSKMMGI
mmetsp:Transcript_19846/g.56117  ORF Transcript_19846/g.56117 Transcript_19846/m.56117 type:complete len:649 (+) Transcript_19846:184-2130(+)